METFFTLLKKSIVATIFTMFAIVATYTPQEWNKPQPAEAWFATEVSMAADLLQNTWNTIKNTLSEAWNYVTSWATDSLWYKESVLDGIAWTLAKSVISSMVDSLISWINSGFKGSPMFVQDLSRFLTDVADRVMGEYIQNLGGLGSFLCDPFKLDIQISLALQYQRQRIDQPAPTCTLSGIIDNISGFIEGSTGSFSEGGWNDWFDITTRPETYTPYGANLAAQSGAQIRILNSKGEEAFKLDWGDGFLSGEICNIVNGPNGSTEECAITKPGKIIEEALSFNLDSGRQSLVTADEMNEIISALFGQLANTAFTGAAGLLGLSGGTGFTYSGFNGGSYTSQMNVESNTIAAGPGLASLNAALNLETKYLNLAIDNKTKLDQIAADPSMPADIVTAATNASNNALTIITETSNNISSINFLITDYNNATDATQQTTVINQLNSLPLHTQTQYNNSQSSWNNIVLAADAASILISGDATLTQMEADLQTQKDYRSLAQLYKADLELYAANPTTSPTDAADATAAAADAQVIIDTTTTLIDDLTDIITGYQAAGSDALRAVYIGDYQDLNLYTETDINNSKAAWDAILP